MPQDIGHEHTLLQGYGDSNNHRTNGVKWQGEHSTEGGALVFSHHHCLGSLYQ